MRSQATRRAEGASPEESLLDDLTEEKALAPVPVRADHDEVEVSISHFELRGMPSPAPRGR